MKKWLSLVSIAVLGLALVIGAACGGGGEEEEEEEVTELKWGVGLALAGGYGAVVGLPAKYAFNMANEKVGEFEVAGKLYRWKLIFEENGASVAGGVASTTKFIYEHDVDFMFQCCGAPGLAAISICEEVGMILDSSGCVIGDFGPDKPHFFQSSATWSAHAAPFLHWLSTEHPEVKRVAVVAPDDPTGYAIGYALRASAEHFGLEIVAEEYTPAEIVEYMPVATKVMASDPDIYVGVSADIYDIMKAMGYEGLAASYYWLEGVGPEKVGWDTCEGYLTFLPNPIGDVWPEVMAFRADYEDRYGVEFNPSCLWAANVVYLWTGILQAAGTVDDMDKIIETAETVPVDTLIGPLGFGGEELNGIGHVTMYPTPILKVVGDHEYELLAMYNAEETEALAVEVFAD